MTPGRKAASRLSSFKLHVQTPLQIFEALPSRSRNLTPTPRKAYKRELKKKNVEGADNASAVKLSSGGALGRCASRLSSSYFVFCVATGLGRKVSLFRILHSHSSPRSKSAGNRVCARTTLESTLNGRVKEGVLTQQQLSLFVVFRPLDVSCAVRWTLPPATLYLFRIASALQCHWIAGPTAQFDARIRPPVLTSYVLRISLSGLYKSAGV
ncbi:hypothetical protein DFH06DRAFT_1484830 [Mycena polygramma]|nr:hypothetical protein DFH06DRAFT_1484830 [Mycena polygramma]